MDESIYEIIPKIENTKEFLDVLARNIQSFQRMRKMNYLMIIG